MPVSGPRFITPRWRNDRLEDDVVFPQGATDSEKRVLCLSAENETLKQSLTVTQGLLQQLSSIPSQSSTMLIKVRQLRWCATVTTVNNIYHYNWFGLRALAGKREPPQQSAAAGDLFTATRRTTVTTGATERTKWVEERRAAEETRGQGERAAAGAGQRKRQRASGEGNSNMKRLEDVTIALKREQNGRSAMYLYTLVLIMHCI